MHPGRRVDQTRPPTRGWQLFGRNREQNTTPPPAETGLAAVEVSLRIARTAPPLTNGRRSAPPASRSRGQRLASGKSDQGATRYVSSLAPVCSKVGESNDSANLPAPVTSAVHRPRRDRTLHPAGWD